MREIKYRAWDIELQEMRDDFLGKSGDEPGDWILFFKKEVHKELKVCQPLNGIAELMGWKYQTVRLDKPTKVIKISLKRFMSFLYPTEADEVCNLEGDFVT